MIRKRGRAATLIAGGAVLVAWAAAAGFPDVPVPQVPAPDRSSETRTVDAFDVDTGQLRAKLARARPRPSVPVRDPFRFGRRAPAAAAVTPGTDPSALSTASAGPPLPLVLAGIAEQDTAAGSWRTAVISDAARLYLVREGESVMDRYRVERIGADAVELRDGLTGAIVWLGLR